jgi:hypothetical protein
MLVRVARLQVQTLRRIAAVGAAQLGRLAGKLEPLQRRGGLLFGLEMRGVAT